MRWVGYLLVGVLGGVLAPLASMAKGTDRPKGLSVPRPISSPARAGSREPNLEALPDGGWVMSWLEPGAGTAMALRCATYRNGSWSRPATIAAGDSFFVNWADFPSIRSLGGNRLAAHWLWRNGAGTYAYDVRVSQSVDGGLTWSRPVTPHRDGTASEHGFVSLLSDSGLAWAAWLDGRAMAGHDEHSAGPMPSMTLRAASISADGQLSDEVELDDRTCDCCQTAAVQTDRGIVVAYRDRSADEIRDIFVIRREGGRWTKPRVVHADRWEIAGCPVNGPALSAQGSDVAIVWYTAAADSPRVRLAFSHDSGETFGDPVRIDEGNPLGRVHVAMLADGSALVTWLETSGRDAHIRARRVTAQGIPQLPITIASTSAARASGFPRVLLSDSGIVFAWTEAGKTPMIRTALLAASGLGLGADEPARE